MELRYKENISVWLEHVVTLEAHHVTKKKGVEGHALESIRKPATLGDLVEVLRALPKSDLGKVIIHATFVPGRSSVYVMPNENEAEKVSERVVDEIAKSMAAELIGDKDFDLYRRGMEIERDKWRTCAETAEEERDKAVKRAEAAEKRLETAVEDRCQEGRNATLSWSRANDAEKERDEAVKRTEEADEICRAKVQMIDRIAEDLMAAPRESAHNAAVRVMKARDAAIRRAEVAEQERDNWRRRHNDAQGAIAQVQQWRSKECEKMLAVEKERDDLRLARTRAIQDLDKVLDRLSEWRHRVGQLVSNRGLITAEECREEILRRTAANEEQLARVRLERDEALKRAEEAERKP